MLGALMGGMALTATELALEAGIAPSTASEHLAKLTDGRVLRLERQGRHRYFRLFDAEIAGALEGLMVLSANRGPRRRPGPADADLRAARVCYDHLAGARGVWLLEQLCRRGLLAGAEGDGLTAEGAALFGRLGLDLATLARARRPLCRRCLDWSERRHHLGGELGAALLERLFALGWARRKMASRAILFTEAGERSLHRVFGTA